jgi:hypothetical protein
MAGRPASTDFDVVSLSSSRSAVIGGGDEEYDDLELKKALLEVRL